MELEATWLKDGAASGGGGAGGGGAGGTNLRDSQEAREEKFI